MATNYYSIDDGDGNQITTGVAPHLVSRMAQRMADERGEAVYYYGSDDEGGADSIEVVPSISHCSVCGKPTHASESDDLDRCEACIDAEALRTTPHPSWAGRPCVGGFVGPSGHCSRCGQPEHATNEDGGES